MKKSDIKKITDVIEGSGWYLSINNDEQWGKCFWCNTISHDNMIEYDDNGEQVCPECKRAGAMLKL